MLIWQAKHGDPTSATNNASRPVAGFSGTINWDSSAENVSIGSNSGVWNYLLAKCEY